MVTGTSYDIGVVAEIIHATSGARAAIELAISLAKLGHTISFYACDTAKNPQTVSYLKRNGITVYTVSFPTTKLLGRLVGAVKLYKLLCNSNHQVLQVQAVPSFFMAATLSDKPIVTTYYGTQLNVLRERLLPNSLLIPFVSLFDKLVNVIILIKSAPSVLFADKVISISKYCKYELRRYYKINSDVIYIGPAQNLGKKQATPKLFHILSVSRITPYKGFHKIIKVFNTFVTKNHKVKLTIAGSTPVPKYLDYLQKIKHKHVSIIVNPTDQQLAYLYQSASVYVSFDEYLFFGMPPVEAALFGVPALVYNRCASGELINPGKNGYIFNSEAELSFYLERLFHNKNQLKILGKNARLLAKRFNWHKTAKEYELVFTQVIQKGKNYTVLLMFILLLGIGLRSFFIVQHNIWFDEANNYFFSIKPINELLLLSASNNTPPLFLLLQHFWLKFVPHTATFIRFPIFIYSCLSLLLVYRVIGFFTNNRIRLFVTTLFTFSPLALYNGGDARSTGLFLLLTLLYFYFFLSFLVNRKKTLALLLFFTQVAILYTHYYGLLFCFLVIIYCLINANKLKLPAKYIFVIQCLALLMFVPWIRYTTGIVSSIPYHYPPVKNIVATYMQFTLGELRLAFFSPHALPIIKLFFGFVLILFLGLFIKGIKKTGETSFIYVFFFMPIIVLFLLSLRYPVYSVHSLFFLLPWFFLIVAHAIQSLSNRLLVYVLTGISLLSVSIIQYIYPLYNGGSFKETALQIHLLQPNIVVHESSLTYTPLLYYVPDKIHYLLEPNPLTPLTQRLVGILPLQQLPNERYILITKKLNVVIHEAQK